MQTVHLVHYTAKPGGLEVKMPLRVSGIKNYRVKVFIIRAEPDESVYRNTNIETTYGSNVKTIAFIKFFFYALKNRKDIFHLFNAGPFFLTVLNSLRVKKVVYSIHGTIYWRSPLQKAIRKFFWNLGLSKNTIITANSEYSSKIFKEKIAMDSSPILIYNPIDLEKFNAVNRKPAANDIKIIYVGRLVNGKNLDKWLDAAMFLLEKGMKVMFEIYGDGHYKTDLQKRINESVWHEKIILKGHANNVEDVYRNADLLLFLSAYESFGNVAVESILCGTPVISFDIPPMLEIFKNYPEFVIKNKEGFESVLCDKLKKISDLKTLTSVASKEFAERFGAEIYKRKLEEIYAKLN